jgi:hypothetical protein
MKKMIALGLALFASTALAAVSSTKHNMNSFIGSGSTDPCFYCHVAHNGGTRAPLWARTDPTTSGVYTFFTSNTISSNTPTLGISLACLSCHDGSIGVATTITGQVNTTNKFITNVNKKVGPNLSNDHPIGLVWNTAFAGLAASTAISPFKLYGASSNQIECASCHAVHGSTGTGVTSTYQFMRADPASGNFCATCHVNK